MVIRKKGSAFFIDGKEFKIGGGVFANDESEYMGLYGTVTEIRTDEDRETENDTPDIYCEFMSPDSVAMAAELETRFSDLYRQDMQLEEISLDCVIMSPEMLEEAIRDRIRQTGRTPKAIIPVDLYGMPASMGEIMEIAGKYGIPVLEDAAEALGSEYRGRKCGVFGTYGAFSFNGNKIITTSGGGALCCPDEESRNRVKFYATQARDQAPHYEHTHIGYNYRLSNVCAGIGRGQMLSLPSFLEKRRGIHEEYRRRLSGVPGLSLLENPDSRYHSNHWLTCVQVNPEEARFDRETLRLALQKAGVESRPLWKPMHLQPVFRSCPFYGSGVSDRLFEQGLCLPSGASLAGEDVDRIIDVLLNL